MNYNTNLTLINEFQHRQIPILLVDRIISIPRPLRNSYISPAYIDLSEMRVQDFVKIFSDTMGYTISYKTNKRKLSEVQWFGLGDMHGFKDCYHCNTLLTKLLWYPHHRNILIEDEGNCTKDDANYFIGAKKLPENLRYTGWDDLEAFQTDYKDGLGTSSDSIRWVISLGQILQRIAYVAKRDLKIPFHKKNRKKDSFEKIGIDLRDFYKLQQEFIENFIRKIKKIDPRFHKYFSDSYNRVNTFFLQSSQQLNNPHCLLLCIKWLKDINSVRMNHLVQSTFKLRQKSLCRTLSSVSKGLIVAGESHLVTGNKIEKNVKTWFRSTRQGYLIIFNQEEKGKLNHFSDHLQKALIDSANDICKIDFHHLPKGGTFGAQLHANLLPIRYERTKWLIDSFYHTSGCKKPSEEAPKKRRAL